MTNNRPYNNDCPELSRNEAQYILNKLYFMIDNRADLSFEYKEGWHSALDYAMQELGTLGRAQERIRRKSEEMFQTTGEV
jgi:hypothetical protein